MVLSPCTVQHPGLISNQDTDTQVMFTYLASSTCESKCLKIKCVGRGYSSLSLRTKSLYICSYVVLKSYTFGLSGAGPGSFTWDPVPKERTSNPRLLQRGQDKRVNYATTSRKTLHKHNDITGSFTPLSNLECQPCKLPLQTGKKKTWQNI